MSKKSYSFCFEVKKIKLDPWGKMSHPELAQSGILLRIINYYCVIIFQMQCLL